MPLLSQLSSSLIDNQDQTLQKELEASLEHAERIDIATAFFYFSGFVLLVDKIKDIKLRILVGNFVDPKCVDRITNLVRQGKDIELASFADRDYSLYNNSKKKDQYIKSFVDMFNKSKISEDVFDFPNQQKAFKLLFDKLRDGSLEIKLTSQIDHAKYYIITRKQEYNENGRIPGPVFMGSSNFTYNGLLKQGELNMRLESNEFREQFLKKFETDWTSANAIDICTEENNVDFTREIENKIWLFSQPSPYEIYVRVLHELYGSLDQLQIVTPSEITNQKYLDLQYQTYAIKFGIDCLDKHNGVIIADVVGLGKSIIASAIANNYINVSKTIIIAPPNLKNQWDEYVSDFRVPRAIVESSGMIETIHEKYMKSKSPILFIIDEAHRYRNEKTQSYMFLHQLTRSHPQNKVILLTATPYNNRPEDLYSLIKLFQIPNISTINCEGNLSDRFADLIKDYKSCYDEAKKELTVSAKKKLNEISMSLRLLLTPVTIRRTRIDIAEIKEYADDLKKQTIQFPEVIGPELIEYDLGATADLYTDTLVKIDNCFTAARYNPLNYIKIEMLHEFQKDFPYIDISNDQWQANLIDLIKRSLVIRFESSQEAFKKTLINHIGNYELILKNYDEGNFIYNLEKASLNQEQIFYEFDNDEPTLDIKDTNNGVKTKNIKIPKKYFSDLYHVELKNDLNILKEIYNNWFDCGINISDMKLKCVLEKIKKLFIENKDRKIVVFSSFADTASYVNRELNNLKLKSMLYTGSSSKDDNITVSSNFDASYSMSRNDYNIVVATDALSEGFNLNRAGVIINYDIPYNPTVVIQRIGRINRINKMVFDKIYIYNLFPTAIGEKEIYTKGITNLKMHIIHQVAGNDTKVLTQNEEITSFFKDQYEQENSKLSDKSWDVEFINEYNTIKNNFEIIENLKKKIPERTRIVRDNKKEMMVSFAKKGSNARFAAKTNGGNVEFVSSETALKYFKADRDERSYAFDGEMAENFKCLCDALKNVKPRTTNSNQESKAIKILKNICINPNISPDQKNYIISLCNAIEIYSDLCDHELQYVANINKNKRFNSIQERINDMQKIIPVCYVNNIIEKANNFDSEQEIIMFTEEFKRMECNNDN
ncbi:MAG: phospholipase D-like domain-containing protein [Christensenellaceae bacterium]|jgi:ERCC4-related helicase|nr:phospholipase D-like domain-containing protein [Christensenellaceae bacterium]